MKIELLKGAKNLQELKKLYFELAKKLHPDLCGGSVEKMQKLNAEYDYLKTHLKNDTNIKEESYKESSASMESFKDIINDLVRFTDLEFDIIGTWLYIKGSGTFAIKDYLKEQYHCRFSKGHKCWYWFNGIENTTKVRANKKAYENNKAIFGVVNIKSHGTPILS